MGSHSADAIERYRALLEHDPGSRAFGRLAEAYLGQARYRDAIGVCDRGLEHHPDFVGARLILARALAEYGDAARAEAEFRRVLQGAPDNLPAHRGLADLLRRQGRTGEALAVYDALLELDPFDPEVCDLVAGLRPSTAPPPGVIAAGREPGPDLGPEVEIPLAPAEPEPAVPAYDLTEAAVAAPPLPLTPVEPEPAVAAAAEEPLTPPPAPVPAPPEPAVPVYDLTDIAREEEEPPFVPVEPLEPEELPGRAIVATETLAELYVTQGFPEQARAIYEELARAEPGRADLREKLAALQVAAAAPAASLGAPAPEPAGPPAPPADGDDLVGILEAWLAAAQGLRAERRRA